MITIGYCTWCGSPNIKRSTRKGFLEKRLLKFMLIKPFRCRACGRRFYLFLKTFGVKRNPGTLWHRRAKSEEQKGL
jgi:hypothetical protein